MDSILIINIKQLVGIQENINLRYLKGKEMSVLNIIENAFLYVENELIADFGKMEDINLEYYNSSKIEDAQGKLVLPTWCDSHTHLVFAGYRQNEFVDKIKGLTYEQIAANGGGILNSAQLLQKTTEDDLYQSASRRLVEIMKLGTGAVEIKSGYGLDTVSEIKMLRVIKRLKENFNIPIKATFLGAHAVPQNFKNRREDYITEIVEKMLPQIAAENLADYCDVFCDRGFFTIDETDKILSAAAKLGLQAKIHANELDFSGGIQVGVKNNALSVDHLECTGKEEIEVLLKSQTMPTLLPSTAFFLGIDFPPARLMIDSGLPISLASDYNPGSSPSGNMNFILSLACIKLKILPEEAFNAATINAAYAMGMEKESGSITKGKQASIIITEKIENYTYLPYAFGNHYIDKVMIRGEFV
jgi:imidazolonepropionase